MNGPIPRLELVNKLPCFRPGLLSSFKHIRIHTARHTHRQHNDMLRLTQVWSHPEAGGGSGGAVDKHYYGTYPALSFSWPGWSRSRRLGVTLSVPSHPSAHWCGADPLRNECLSYFSTDRADSRDSALRNVGTTSIIGLHVFCV